ncbi:MAG TPA: hypothetical protein VFF06_10120 [Polyangia bacterium]|nr:hypothetical protein [Polyangia bacterium]
MNVEDSYEGALRRLNRLRHAGLDFAPPPPALPPENDESDRMRDLEELATLACDENERLKEELGGARGEIARLQRLSSTLREMLASAQSDDAAAAPEEVERLSHELVGARGEIERLRQLVATLQDASLDVGSSTDDSLSVPRQRGAGFYFFTVLAVGGAAAALFILRPWERHSIPVASSAAALPSAPIAAAPAPTVEPLTPKSEPLLPKSEPLVPKVEPLAPKAEPVVPKVAATIPKVAPAKVEPAKVAAAKPARRHAPKHHASKSAAQKPHKRSPVKAKLEPRGDDPLGGLNM